MRRKLCIFNVIIEYGIICTTHLMRDNSKFTIKDLKSIVVKIKKQSLPLTVNHDRTLLIGYVDDAEIVKLEDGEYGVKARVNIFENPREQLGFKQYYLREEKIEEQIILKEGESVDIFKRKDFWCDVLDGKNIVYEYFPNMVDKLDDDKLLSINSNMELRQCGIIYENYILLYNPFFRRSHSRLNNFNTDFLQNFLEIRKKETLIDMRISIDLDLIGLKDTFHYYMELDYWHGPKLKGRDFGSLEDGVTVHGRVIDVEGWFQILKTEFFWYTKNGIKTLQIEEINKDPIIIEYNDKQFAVTRYVHSQYDIEKKMFVHLDGAVRLYELKSYDERKSIKINEIKKGPVERIKLFLIQSEIDYQDWIKLVHFYFRGNPYIPEYFT